MTSGRNGESAQISKWASVSWLMLDDLVEEGQRAWQWIDADSVTLTWASLSCVGSFEISFLEWTQKLISIAPRTELEQSNLEVEKLFPHFEK
jgi:hypothetical protein